MIDTNYRRLDVADHIDNEIEAIKAVLLALEPLPLEIRASVLDYVIKRLQITLESAQQTNISPPTPVADIKPDISDVTKGAEPLRAPVHIMDLKKKKQPRSAIEMAVLVAYYLENEAPPIELKDSITSKEINTYFKIAEFPLPGNVKFTLPNARAAGYLDAVGNGEYKLAIPRNVTLAGAKFPPSPQPLFPSGKRGLSRLLNHI
tara:strand:- start:518 stop:1129 length:612 start_codon:yes stop_codon:yes gene_type:complete